MSVRLTAAEFKAGIASLGTSSKHSPSHDAPPSSTSEINLSSQYASDAAQTSPVTVIPAKIMGSESPGDLIVETEEVRYKLCSLLLPLSSFHDSVCTFTHGVHSNNVAEPSLDFANFKPLPALLGFFYHIRSVPCWTSYPL